MEDSPEVCSECGAKVTKESKFCMECGKPLEEKNNETIEDTQSTVNCPYCNAKITPEDKFCTECGKKIEPVTTCPKCDTKIKPGNRFCMQCGTNVYEYKPETEIEQINQPKIPSKDKSGDESIDEIKKTGDDLLKDVEKTGRGLMKDLGSFLEKSAGSDSKKTIKPQKKEQRYLVCNKCGGYYELQKGEEPQDFDDNCECGGKLEYKESLAHQE